MAIRKNNNKWLFEKYLSPTRRIRKQFATKGEALAYEKYLEEQSDEKPWINEKIDRRHISDLVDLWFDNHGKALDNGEKIKKILMFICKCIDDPLVDDFTAKDFTNYRKKRMEGKFFRTTKKQIVSLNTLNKELIYFRAVFNELKRLGEWNRPNPLENIKAFKLDESEMAWLNHEQIALLLKECANSQVEHLLLKVEIGLSTGARWGEICELVGSRIANCKITYSKTKGGKNRTIPISKDLFSRIPKTQGRIFPEGDNITAFRRALKRCKIDLPDGQLTHVLRHTFGAHFMMNGGNILVLQKY
jgi:integrase